MDHIGLWLEFIVAASIVIAAGLSLSRNAEELADAMGWGHALTGFVVLGWATSLPELTISVSAVTDLDSAGLAAGNITGSVLFNLAILAGLFFAIRPARPKPGKTGGVHALGVANLILIGGVVVLVNWPDLALAGRPALLAFLLLGGYGATTLYIWRSQRDEGPVEIELPPKNRVRPAVRCLAAGAVILGTGIWLARVGDHMADAYSLTDGFVGTLFLASVSSLPELVAGIGAMRLGLVTMAAASILGSNVFNLGILGLCDALYLADHTGALPLLLEADDPRLVTNLVVCFALTAGAMLVVSLRRRSAPRALTATICAAMLAAYSWALFFH